MKITGLEILRADAGWRNACYLKMTTDAGLVGWSEFGEHTGTAGLGAVIEALGELLIGLDPTAIEQAAALLKGRTMQAPGGMNQHAIAALTNAMLDIKGKALGVPVHALLGGALRESIEVYWSHCATYRVRQADMVGKPRVATFDDLVRVGEEARAKGYRALKTGLMAEGADGFVNVGPGFAFSPGYPALNPDPSLVATMVRQLQALREGAGPEMAIMIDVNCHFRTEGFLQIARAAAPLGLAWLEVDSPDPQALARIRDAVGGPLASLETLYGRRGLMPFLAAGAVDVAIIDLAWNGYLEALRMAALADSFDVNVASHNYCGGLLSDAVNAHFGAAVPNFRIGEWDEDDVPWKPEFLTAELRVENGTLAVPQGPGWGVDVNEAFVRSHPPR